MPELKVQGIRTKENEKFINFFKLVNEKARAKNSIFFLDTGDCEDVEFKNMELDTLFGWLIPLDKSSEFEELFINNLDLNKYDDFYRVVNWKIINDDVEVTFE